MIFGGKHACNFIILTRLLSDLNTVSRIAIAWRKPCQVVCLLELSGRFSKVEYVAPKQKQILSVGDKKKWCKGKRKSRKRENALRDLIQLLQYNALLLLDCNDIFIAVISVFKVFSL